MNEKAIKAFRDSRQWRGLKPVDPTCTLDLATEARMLYHLDGSRETMEAILDELVLILRRQHDYYTDPDYAVRQAHNRKETMG